MVWKKGNGVKETAIGNIIMAIALIVGVIFLGYSAVQNISSMFMEELAGRREQFVESKLEDYINSLEFAVELLTTENLSSEKNFQSYQYRLKHVYGLERFAFVDSNGLISTEYIPASITNSVGSAYGVCSTESKKKPKTKTRHLSLRSLLITSITTRKSLLYPLWKLPSHVYLKEYPYS